MIVTNLSIRNRTTVFVVAAALIVSGVWCYVSLPREAAPDVTIPIIVISTSQRGVSPEDIESSITDEIEKKLKGLADVKEIMSTSSEGFSRIVVEFEPTIDIDVALQKVRDKVDQAGGDIPSEADDPLVTEVNVSQFPVLIINVAGDVGLVRLKEIADDMQDEIETVNGVIEANVLGGREREIRIEIDPDRLAAYNIPIGDLITLVATENVNVSAGSIDTPDAKFTVRVPGEFVDPREIQTLVVTTVDGKPIYLTDVAEICDTFKDRTSYSRVSPLRDGSEGTEAAIAAAAEGRECVSISVQKRAGENSIRITDEVKEIVARWRERLPDGVTLEISLDQSEIINLLVHDLENNILTGFTLVAIVIFIVMGARNAGFVSLAVPMSMLITFSVLTAIGITLNFVTLFALTLSLGMLVDNAIVIVENIYRHMQEGYTRIEAAKLGAAEVAWPVTASTLTTVAAFSPLVFWPGIMGKFMGFLPKTVIITLLASLFVALVVNPALCSVFMRVKKAKVLKERRSSRFISAYRSILAASLANRVVTIGAAVLTLALVVLLYGRFGKGVELFPEGDPARAFINIKAPEGTSIEKADAVARACATRLAAFKNVERYVTNVGAGSSTDPFGGGGTDVNQASISIEFLDFAERIEPSSLTIKNIRAAVEDIPGVEITVKQEEEGPPVGEPVTIEISGDDFDVLARLARDARDRIRTVAGLVDLKDDYDEARPELRFVVDRNRARLLGMDTDHVGFYLKTAILGTDVGKFRQGDEEYDITVRLPLDQRDDPDKVRRLYIPTMDGRMVPISSVVDVKYSGGLGSIKRKDLNRVVTITGTNDEGYLPSKLLAECRERLADLPLPPGYRIDYAGEDEESVKASRFLAKAFIAALFLIAIVLVTEFDSATTPLIIMASVLFSLTGVVVGLLILEKPFGIVMTGVGSISLAGVVVNNAIVLLDYVEKLRTRGIPRTEALIRAGMTRLRPVLLTAITTILGLIPMATGVSFDFRNRVWQVGSESSQWWGQMATAVIFGLAVATLLTLVVVPAMYSVLDDLKAFFGAPWRPKEDDEKFSV